MLRFRSREDFHDSATWACRRRAITNERRHARTEQLGKETIGVIIGPAAQFRSDVIGPFAVTRPGLLVPHSDLIRTPVGDLFQALVFLTEPVALHTQMEQRKVLQPNQEAYQDNRQERARVRPSEF